MSANVILGLVELLAFWATLYAAIGTWYIPWHLMEWAIRQTGKTDE
jgi:hypothetical protein